MSIRVKIDLLEDYKMTLGEDVLRDLVQTFIADVNQRLEVMKSEYAAENYEAVGRQGHAIKGAAASLGAVKVVDLGKDIQVACEEKNYETLDVLISEIQTEISATCDEIKGFVEQ